MNTEDIAAFKNKIEMAIGNSNFYCSLRLCEKAIFHFPKENFFYQRKAEIYQLLGLFQASIRVYELLLARNPQSADYACGIGASHFFSANYFLAEKYLVSCLLKDSDYILAYPLLIETYIKLEQHSEAQKLISTCLEKIEPYTAHFSETIKVLAELSKSINDCQIAQERAFICDYSNC